MKKNKIGPIILVVVLIVVLFFILGVRYGQKVEQSNKVINYLLSITPTRIPPTQQSLEFVSYKNTKCGIEFLYPSSLKLDQQGTWSAQFSENKKKVLAFDCVGKRQLLNSLGEEKIASREVVFKNPISEKNIYVLIKSNLLPLFESSLQYVNQ